MFSYLGKILDLKKFRLIAPYEHKYQNIFTVLAYNLFQTLRFPFRIVYINLL